MIKPHQEPSFRPRELKAGSGWYVLVTWPNGDAEHVNGFTSDLEAKGWISTQSRSWLKARTRRGNG
jgi:hypothetical protein